MKRLFVGLGIASLLLTSAGPALAVSPPANDSASTPTVIGSLPFSDALDTTTATFDPTDPTSCGTPTNTVWYTFNAGQAGNGHVVFSVLGSDYGAGLSIFVGSPSGTFDGCGGALDLVAAPNTTYYIMVGDFSGLATGGILQLSVTQGLLIGSTINPIASINTKTHVVTVTGTYTCNMPTTIVGASVTVKQTIGRFIVSGSGDSQFSAACTPGTPGVWATTVVGSTGNFAPGKATAQAQVYSDPYVNDPGSSTALSIRR